LIARTDINGADYISSTADEVDHRFIDFDKRTEDGFYGLKGDPVERSVARGLSFEKYADCLWMETNRPDLGEATAWAHGIHEKAPGKLLAYNCSPSFNWKRHLSDKEIAEFQDKLGELGFRFAFITLASFHANNLSSYKLAHEYQTDGMSAFVRLQQESFEWQAKGYTAVKHQAFAGTGWWDTVQSIVDGHSDMSALANSTEAHQF
jgi:isocitrate lyase